MQNPPASTGVPKDSRPADRKRKLSGRQLSTNIASADVPPPNKQQTISDLFSSQQLKPSSTGPTGTQLSPSGKRPKLESNLHSSPPPASEGDTPNTLPSERMYNFPSKNG